MSLVASLVVVLLLATVHVRIGSIKARSRKTHDQWHSVAGGVATTYAFLVLMPKLAAAQVALQRDAHKGVLGFFEHHSYLLALIGFATYYALDGVVESLLLRPRRRTNQAAVRITVYVFASAFSVYYALMGYLLGEMGDRTLLEVGLYGLAMIVHTSAIDDGLSQKFLGLYDRWVRWTLAAATIGGWLLAVVTEISYTTLALWQSFFAGILLITAIKDELPSSRQMHFRSFLYGSLGFAVLVLLIEALKLSG